MDATDGAGRGHTVNDNPHAPVVVGIDGSDTAIHAAQWAVDEAVSRSVPLRLVSVIKATHPSKEDYYADVHHAETALRAASAAIEATGKPVKVETTTQSGPAGAVLIGESRDADLICVGSVGIGRYARALLGSTASELAERARCPVAVIRPPTDQRQGDVNWIVVVLNHEPDNQAVAEAAMVEAELRHAPVLALGAPADDLDDSRHDGLERQVQQWKSRYPEVHLYPIATRDDIAHFLEHHHERVQLAVIGPSDAGQLARIIGPQGHPVFRHALSSVLVVRH